ncbi:hypothetical protein N7510_003993 [Penicillium lagena]|uniref:uncharacterized protein n=1 Tax=Penicillium lagena TaxID=94218 RepID=UPI00254114DF|nr:uncharacterized protein N7510_003993 [Penicillium lagena]KAJ5620009.1 hypothetical protein N7510_003993 [Penicillium lagena]
MNHSLRKRENLASISLATQILCFSIVIPLVALRFFAKFKLRLPFGLEDASCYAALILFSLTLEDPFLTPPPQHGIVKSNTEYAHWQNLFTQFVLTNKIFYIATMFYVPMVLFVKTSLIYIMIRLWKPYRGKIISLYTFLGFITTYYTVILFVKIFNCNPIRSFWDVNIPGASCLNRAAIIITDSSISAMTDLAIIIFPIVLTSTLHVPLSKKLHVIAILGAGSIAIAFSIYRLVLVIIERHDSDEIEVFMRVLLSDNGEGGLGLICTCIPSIGKLFSQYNERWKQRNRGKQEQKELCASLTPDRNVDEDEHTPSSLPSISGRDSCALTV